METPPMRNNQVRPARPEHLDDRPEHGTSVERTAVLPASVERVMAALSDPDLLASWLGTCSEDGTRVRTDDGVVRRITGRERDGDSIVRWTWAPDAHLQDRSEV
ncbi:MAG: SRPBCC domain-containing protein, partial [Microthrixaceae bacterium]